MEPTSSETPPGGPPRSPLGWSLIATGGILILWAVLGLASAGYGSRPVSDFSQRRSYNMVKRDVHRAFPFAALRGVGGLALLIFGARRLRRDSSSGEGR